MIRTVIIDDEQHCIGRLNTLLSENQHNVISVEGVFTSVEGGLEGIKKIDPDLVFLDVMLHDATGFDLLQQLDHFNFELIFTTAYEKYAVKAFKFSALDYLLKPIDPDDLKHALEKVHKKLSKNQLISKIDVLMHNMQDIKGISKRIALPTLDGLIFININDIIQCQSDINYTTLFLSNGQTIVVAKTLKEFEDMLLEYNFFRIHNSHLININHIKSYNKGKGGYVIMDDDSKIEVSSRRKGNFMKILIRN